MENRLANQKKSIAVHSQTEECQGRDLSGKETDRASLRCTHILETASGGTCQNTERNRTSEAHSQAGDGMGRDSSGRRKRPTEQGSLTSWRQHREGLIRTQKETDRARHTHILETASRESCQDTERNRPSQAHSPTGDDIERDSSGHRKKPTEPGALTSWRQHREGLVRTQKETDRPRRTHQLETASGGTRQDTERSRPSQAHSPPGDGIGRDSSGHRKRLTDRGALTSWRRHREGLVRTQKKTRPIKAHSLSGDSIERDSSGHRNRLSEAHSHPGDGIGRDSSGQR